MRTRQTLFLILFVLMLPIRGAADDVEIYGTQSVTLEPNVLIIFDTSGSMADPVKKEPYDPDTQYTGSYEHDAVYYTSGGTKVKYTGYLSDSTTKALNVDGYARSLIQINNRWYRAWLEKGNYLHYDALPLPSNGRPKLDVAKDVITELLNDAENEGVNFGLMKFNPNYDDNYWYGRTWVDPNGDDNRGGSIVAACGDATESHVDSFQASGGTPLAEALAEAGLYFAGAQPYFGDYETGTNYYSKVNNRYESPIEWRCQRSYVIIMTDGEATGDKDRLLYLDNYYNSKKIGDYDNDSLDFDSDGALKTYWSDESRTYTTHLLDDVAKFLNTEDMSPLAGGKLMDKNIVVYTIGFNINNTLLKRTADNGKGSYYTADSASDLKRAFRKIMSNIAEESSSFVAPVVPVNRQQRTAGRENIYLAFFKPVQPGDWQGNLKKYALSASGDILDASGVLAVNSDGTMNKNSKSIWTGSENDGDDVIKGGAGERIKAQATRTFYTYTGSESSLTHSSNLFDDTNTALTTLGVTSTQIADIKDGVQDWPVGAIIHSEPAVVHYSRTSSVIYFGSNDGLFRAIDDATGEELWAFVPPGQLSRLSLLSDTDYNYYVDASPTVSYGDLMNGTSLFAPDTLLVGERRGGHSYYALDISAFNQPKYKFTVGKNFLSGDGGEVLGQSWGAPAYSRVKVSSTDDAKVFILPGGYDSNQDKKPTPDAQDSLGRALFAVRVSNGNLAGLNLNHGNWDLMTHSIVDLYAVDPSSCGITSRVYAGDMGGQIFVVADDKNETTQNGNRFIEDKVPDGTWAYKNRLFICNTGKLFYSPVPSDIRGIETLYFGTGNRAAPLNAEANRFYAVRNNWYDSDLSDSDLVNVSDESVSYAASLKTKKGWYFEFTHPNEKVVSRALIYSDVVYFTTYTPPSSNDTTTSIDPCANVGARGVGRLYAVSAVDGTSVTTWGGNTKSRFTELAGNLPIAKPVFDGDNIRVGPMKWKAVKDDRDAYFYWKQRP